MAAGNFTHEIKRELLRNGFESACCKTAALSAFLRTTANAELCTSILGSEAFSIEKTSLKNATL